MGGKKLLYLSLHSKLRSGQHEPRRLSFAQVNHQGQLQHARKQPQAHPNKEHEQMKVKLEQQETQICKRKRNSSESSTTAKELKPSRTQEAES